MRRPVTGDVRWFRSEGQLSSDHTRLVGVMGDITARRQAEELLRASEAKYRNLFENMTDEVHFWQLVRDEQGRIGTWRLVDANPPTLRTWGRRTIEELRGKTTDEIFGPGATEHYLPVVQKIMTEGVPYSFEDYFPHLDRYFRFTSVPLGEYFITTGGDITSIKKAELALRESDRQFKVLIENLESAIALINEHGAFTIVNRSFLRLFELAEDADILNVNSRDWSDWQVFDGNGVLLGVDEHPVRRAALTGRPVLNELVAVQAPGSTARKWIQVSAEPILDAQGRMHRLICTYHDITTLKVAEDALRASLHEKEVLLKEVHHRVKNNLQVLSSLVSLQAARVDDAATRALFADFRDRVRTMALVHENLYQSGTLASIDFAAYAARLATSLARTHSRGEADIRLELAVEPVTLLVESAVPCGLILNELVTNAYKHAFRDRAAGTIVVGLCRESAGRLRLSVRDDGVGLPPGVDWRESPSLGLRLVEMLARQLDGDLWVVAGGASPDASAAGHAGSGTAFHVSFVPATPAAPA